MPALRILLLARTRRLLIVCSETSSALAISAVVRPARVRRVRATWASSGSAGWQQVNISRRRSSGTPLSAASSSRGSSGGDNSGPTPRGMPRRPPPRRRWPPLRLPQRSQLDRPGPGGRVLGGHLDRLVEILALQQVEPSDLLPGLGERPIGHQQLTVAYPDGRGVADRPQPGTEPPHPPHV